MIIPPSRSGQKQELIMGPNIKSLPSFSPLPDTLETEVLLTVGDNITTDDIMPAGAEILPLRSNLPAISQYAFTRIDPTFADRAKEAGSGMIIGGENYGQGSSREHAALAPRYLGIKVVLTKSFARIHLQNLVNFGILPLVFIDKKDYNDVKQGDILRLTNVKKRLRDNLLEIENITTKKTYQTKHTLSQRQMEILVAGGLLEFLKKHRHHKSPN